VSATGYTSEFPAHDHDGADIVSGTVVYPRLDQDVAFADTVFLNRPNNGGIEGADLFQFRYDGQRGGYLNGFACLRARSPVANQYAFRAQAHSGAGSNQAIGSFALSDNTDMFVTYVNGDSAVARDLIVQRNVIVVGLVAASGVVTGSNMQPGAWVAPSFGTNVGDVGSPHAAAGSRVEPLMQVVRLRGELSITGSIVQDATLITLPVGHRPPVQNTFTLRTGGTGAANTFLDVDSDGTVSVRAALVSGGRVNLDGLTFPLT